MEVNIDQRLQRKIGRRRFLMVSAKAFLGVMLTAFIPFNVNGADEAGKKFVMKIKPFKESDLYREHSLVG